MIGEKSLRNWKNIGLRMVSVERATISRWLSSSVARPGFVKPSVESVAITAPSLHKY